MTQQDIPSDRDRRPSRRGFLQTAAAGAAAIGFPTIIPASALGADGHTAPSNRITVGCIGVGGQGMGNMQAFLVNKGAQVMAVCDVDDNHRDNAQRRVNEYYENNDCGAVTDFQELIARDDIDALSIGTPDHWHAIPAIAGARAGKHLYCEKPLGLTIEEGRRIAEEVNKAGVTFQAGTWRRSRPACRKACELVRNGRIGELKTIHIGLPEGFGIRGGFTGEEQPQPVPKNLHYDKWLGRTPDAPYTAARCHFNFRWIMAYSEGYISDWGAHYYDIGQWANDSDLSGPTHVEGWARYEGKGIYDAPTHHELIYTYPNGVKMVSKTTQDQSEWGMRFEGTDGWIYVESTSMKSEPEGLADAEIGPDEIHLYESDDHHGNFLDCIRSGQPTAAHVEIARRSADVCHVGFICARLNRPLQWDPEAGAFINDDEANAMRSRPQRAPYTLPA